MECWWYALIYAILHKGHLTLTLFKGQLGQLHLHLKFVLKIKRNNECKAFIIVFFSLFCLFFCSSTPILSSFTFFFYLSFIYHLYICLYSHQTHFLNNKIILAEWKNKWMNKNKANSGFIAQRVSDC